MIQDIPVSIWISKVVTWLGSIVLAILAVQFLHGSVWFMVGCIALASWNFG